MEWKPLSHEQVADNAWKDLPNVGECINPRDNNPNRSRPRG